MRRSVLILAAVAALSVPAAPAAALPNPGGSGSPGVAAPESAPVWDREVFETGPGHDVVRWRVGDSPTQYGSIGGYATSGPAAVQLGESARMVVVRGRDGAVWMIQRQNDSPWSAWSSLGGLTTDRPALGAGPDGLTLSVRGTDGALWERVRAPSGVWGPWRSTHRAIVGGPGANAYRDADGRVWIRDFQEQWQWRQLPALPNGLRAASEPYFTGSVLVRGSDGQCWSSGGGDWQPLGGRFTSGFAAAGQSDGVGSGSWIYGRGTNGKLYVTGTFYPPGWHLLG